MKRVLEIACFNLESCIVAEKAGADRIELCENYDAGGVTPSNELLLEALKKIQVPVFVMIRPRSGDFVYTAHEIEVMKKNVLFCKENKIPGIVFGILTKENKINAEACREIIELAKPMSATFHRAVDSCEDSGEAVEKLIELGFKRVLTSGSRISAIEGKEIIASLQKKYGDKITIMPGGGIRSSNISGLIRATGCKEFHSSALTDNSSFASSVEIKSLLSILNNF